jgi:hypothetical protein
MVIKLNLLWSHVVVVVVGVGGGGDGGGGGGGGAAAAAVQNCTYVTETDITTVHYYISSKNFLFIRLV